MPLIDAVKHSGGISCDERVVKALCETGRPPFRSFRSPSLFFLATKLINITDNERLI